MQNRTLAAARAAELNGSPSAEQRRERIHNLRSQIITWRKKPVRCLKPNNAEWISRHLGIPYEDLVCRSLSEDERRLREADRLEAKARELRGLRAPPAGEP